MEQRKQARSEKLEILRLSFTDFDISRADKNAYILEVGVLKFFVINPVLKKF